MGRSRRIDARDDSYAGRRSPAVWVGRVDVNPVPRTKDKPDLCQWSSHGSNAVPVDSPCRTYLTYIGSAATKGYVLNTLLLGSCAHLELATRVAGELRGRYTVPMDLEVEASRAAHREPLGTGGLRQERLPVTAHQPMIARPRERNRRLRRRKRPASVYANFSNSGLPGIAQFRFLPAARHA
jgi:hypothetical protein